MSKKNNTRGIYIFSDGFNAYYYGLSGYEKQRLIRQHGAIISFTPVP